MCFRVIPIGTVAGLRDLSTEVEILGWTAIGVIRRLTLYRALETVDGRRSTVVIHTHNLFYNIV